MAYAVSHSANRGSAKDPKRKAFLEDLEHEIGNATVVVACQ